MLCYSVRVAAAMLEAYLFQLYYLGIQNTIAIRQFHLPKLDCQNNRYRSMEPIKRRLFNFGTILEIT